MADKREAEQEAGVNKNEQERTHPPRKRSPLTKEQEKGGSRVDTVAATQGPAEH